MSLYEMVLGRHPLAGHLLHFLGFQSNEEVQAIPRLRDVYLYPDSIRILTRTGGGNRADYEVDNLFLESLPGYIRNWDDSYDSTFAWWSYDWPEQYKETLAEALIVLQKKRPDLLSEGLRTRWEEAIKNIGSKEDGTSRKISD